MSPGAHSPGIIPTFGSSRKNRFNGSCKKIRRLVYQYTGGNKPKHNREISAKLARKIHLAPYII
jgi:hypothetical protein